MNWRIVRILAVFPIICSMMTFSYMLGKLSNVGPYYDLTLRNSATEATSVRAIELVITGSSYKNVRPNIKPINGSQDILQYAKGNTERTTRLETRTTRLETNTTRLETSTTRLVETTTKSELITTSVNSSAHLTASIVQTCQLKSVEELLNAQRPRLQLDPSKYMLPVLVWGPNNQLIGLRESILVAIKLNRTLVVPQFYPQYNDKGRHGLQLISALNRIDIQRLAAFVSIISLEEFQTKCNRTTDAIFQLRPATCNDLQNVERHHGLKLFTKEETEKLKTHNLTCPPPAMATYPKNITSKLILDVAKLKETHNITAKCSILLHPYLSLSVDLHNGRMPSDLFDPSLVAQLTTTDNIASANDDVIIAAIHHETKSAPYVEKIAKEFVEKYFRGRDYIAVHWRYDKEVVAAICRLNPRDKICHRNLVPENVAHAIFNACQKMSSQSSSKTHMVYIASPPTIRNFVQQVIGNLTNFQINETEGEISIRTLEDLENFADENYPETLCPDIRPTPNELLSMLEMSICSMSKVFLWSHFSSWSRVIAHMRPREWFPQDDCIFDLASSLMVR